MIQPHGFDDGLAQRSVQGHTLPWDGSSPHVRTYCYSGHSRTEIGHRPVKSPGLGPTRTSRRTAAPGDFWQPAVTLDMELLWAPGDFDTKIVC